MIFFPSQCIVTLRRLLCSHSLMIPLVLLTKIENQLGILSILSGVFTPDIILVLSLGTLAEKDSSFVQGCGLQLISLLHHISELENFHSSISLTPHSNLKADLDTSFSSQGYQTTLLSISTICDLTQVFIHWCCSDAAFPGFVPNSLLSIFPDSASYSFPKPMVCLMFVKASFRLWCKLLYSFSIAE